MILGFDWLQSVSPLVKWFNYGITFKNGFVAVDVPVCDNIKVKLCSFQVIMHFPCTNKGAASWFTFV